MAYIPKTNLMTGYEASNLAPIFELDDEAPSPERPKRTVQKHSPSLKRNKEGYNFFQIDSPTSGRKITSRPMRTSDASLSGSPSREVHFHNSSSTTDPSTSPPKKAGSPPSTPPAARRTLSRQTLKPSSHLNRGNSLWEMLSDRMKSSKNHRNHRKHFFHHRSQPEKTLSFNSSKSIKDFIDGLKDSDRYRPIEIDFSGSNIRSSQFEVLLNHLSFKKCRSLILDGCVHLTAESFSFLIERTKKVRQLDLSNLSFKKRDINKAIATLISTHRRTLLSLSISNSQNLDFDVLEMITQCPKLQFLNLSYASFHYDIIVSRFFDSILTCADMYLLSLLNKHIKNCLKFVGQLESLELSEDDWIHLLTFRGLGKATNILNLPDTEWQNLLDYRKDPDIREALNLPNENWQKLVNLKETMQHESEDLEKSTLENERPQKAKLTNFQRKLLSLPDLVWNQLLKTQAHPDQKAALKLSESDWHSLLKFRSSSTTEWRSLSVSQRKLDSLNLSPSDFSTLSFLNQTLHFLPLKLKEYHDFFNIEKLSFAELKAFIATNNKLASSIGSDTIIERLYGLHQTYSYNEIIPDIFIKISEALLPIYPAEPLDQNMTSMKFMLAFQNALSRLDVPDIAPDQNAHFTSDLEALGKTCKYVKNDTVFEFLQTRINLLPTLFNACPDLNSLDVSSFLLPFHINDIGAITDPPLKTFTCNDIEWIQKDMSLFQELFKHTPYLDSLSFSNSGHPQFLPFYKSSLPNLKQLNISYQTKMTIESIELGSSHFQNLEELDLSFCPLFLEFPLVIFLLKNGKNLKSLHLDLPTFSYKNLKFLLAGISDSYQTQVFYSDLPSEIRKNITLPNPIKGLGDQLTSLTIPDHLLTPKRLKDIIRLCPNLQFLNSINLNDLPALENPH